MQEKLGLPIQSTIIRSSTFILVVFQLLFSTPATTQSLVEEPSGFRGEPYRSPVPQTLSGAKVLTNDSAYALWQKHTAKFIDVLPRTPKPKNLPQDAFWLEKTRISIKGAYWLPNVGYQKLSEPELVYVQKALKEISNHNRMTSLVFFCLEDCWMSWNAAKRALNLGYENVYWYPEGTDGWLFEEYPTHQIKPYSLSGSE